MYLYLFAICMFLWKNAYSVPLPIFKLDYLWVLVGFFVFCVFLLLSCTSSFYILDINPLSAIWFSNIFYHSIGRLFILLMVSFVQKLFSLKQSYLFIFALLLVLLVSYPKIIASTNVKELFPYVFFQEFYGFRFLTFKSLINFELICEWYKIGVQFHSFSYEYPVFPAPFVEETVFSPLGILGPLFKLVDCIHRGLFLDPQFCSVGVCVCFYASTVLF